METILGLGLFVGLPAGLIVLGVLIAMAFRRVVEPNEVHIVQSTKTTQTYGRGSEAGNSYYEWPAWIPVIGVQTIVLPLSVFDLDLTDYEAYDIGKVPFVVDVVAFFRIANPEIASERIQDLTELRCQLESILQGAVRTILAKHEIEEIMMERSTFGELFTKEVHDQLKAWGVENVKNIELMDIRDGQDSKTVSNIMAKKESLIEMQSRQEVAENLKEAQLAEIDAQRETDVRAQAAAQLVGERTAEKDKVVGIADEKAKQEIAGQAATTATKDMAVAQIENVRAAEIARDVRVVKADEARQVDIVETEGEKQKTVLTAEGNLVEAQRNAEGISAVGEAEAEAKRLLEMSTVSPQIALAQEIGENEGYQTYLIRVREVEKDEVVGTEQAKALQDAGIKVIANTGNVSNGVETVMDLFSTKGGTAVGGMLEAFAQTPQGQALLASLGANEVDERIETAATAEDDLQVG